MKKVIKNIPNIVTSIRLIMAVLAPITLLYNEYLLSLIFYLVGGISDALDGFLARKLNAYSEFGKKLDGQIIPSVSTELFPEIILKLTFFIGKISISPSYKLLVNSLTIP